MDRFKAPARALMCFIGLALAGYGSKPWAGIALILTAIYLTLEDL